MPNALGVPVNLPHPVERDAVGLPLGIGELKGLRAFRGKAHFLQGNQDNPILGSVVISQLKVSLGKLSIPPDAVKQFMNGNHSEFMTTAGRGTTRQTQGHASAGNIPFVRGPYFEIIGPGPLRFAFHLVPPVEDFAHLDGPFFPSKSARCLIRLGSGVAFDLDQDEPHLLQYGNFCAGYCQIGSGENSR